MSNQNYGGIEHRIAGFLGRFPALKRYAKKTYQRINLHIHKKKYPFRCEQFRFQRMGDNPFGEFFGYYQNFPERNGKIAYLAPTGKSLKYQRGFAVDVCVNGKTVSQSTAWNWQQGCMLWWLNNHEICHNIFEANSYKTKIVNWLSGDYRLVDLPLCAVAPGGGQGYSIDFENLAKLNPDYGYFCKKPHGSVKQSKTISLVNIFENRVVASLDMQAILDIDFRPEFNDSKHEINHVAISPNGQRIMFIHRWYKAGAKRQSRLITANRDFTELYNLADGGMVSHCTWKNHSQIIGWMQFDGKSAYYLMNDRESRHEVIGAEVLRSDGHPTVIEEEWLLTDTYPDRARMSQLLLYHLKTHEMIKLGEFYSPLKFWGATRCDLHPKYSPESQSVFFESVHTGQRCLYQMSLADVLKP